MLQKVMKQGRNGDVQISSGTCNKHAVVNRENTTYAIHSTTLITLCTRVVMKQCPRYCYVTIIVYLHYTTMVCSIVVFHQNGNTVVYTIYSMLKWYLRFDPLKELFIVETPLLLIWIWLPAFAVVVVNFKFIIVAEVTLFSSNPIPLYCGFSMSQSSMVNWCVRVLYELVIDQRYAHYQYSQT